ncbi:MAG: 2-C-methyl-D-erythritol 2,4-cyclodiphosphate synthase [Actinomycetia bacterium]|nr:2-C-methyl-D-erythritol 2,4-cyclodiphosphate synthase [Actinomycetes bacterium]
MKVGLGFDIHPLVTNRKLIIGGVKIKYEKGLLGHSDADVLTHAIMDALLGAVALGDIGRLFPASDEKYKNISSLILLDKVVFLLKERGFKVENVDAIVICQEPKLLPYLENMTKNLASHLKIDFKNINVKVKSAEGIGNLGKGDAISALAVTMISPL